MPAMWAEADALDQWPAGIGLDLTARDTQSELKARACHRGPKAKAFATAACVSAFAPASAVANPQALTFSLTVNGERRQQGDTALMLFPLAQLISFLSQHYGLTAGDLIYTGTPEGVARLQSGDALALGLDGLAPGPVYSGVMSESANDKVRLDKWLWAARFYKTARPGAGCHRGRPCGWNGERPKPRAR